MYEFDPRRLEKLAALRESGVEPYPNGLELTHSLAQLIEIGGDKEDAELQELEQEFSIAGRLRFKNEMGKAGFCRIQDESGRIQLFVRKNDLGEQVFADVWKKLDLGDWVWATGKLMRTRKGELSLKCSALRLYSKCIESLPDKHKGFTDAEMRQRMRYLDLFINEDTRDTFRKRSLIVRGIRRYFDDQGFMEVETPMLQAIPGGANARPFVTHHNALGMDMYMRVAPELYLKRLVVGGFERVYELNRNFRNEGVSLKHNPEFTMLEFYQAHATFHDLMDHSEELISGLAQEVSGGLQIPYGDDVIDYSRPWKRASMESLITEHAGVSDPWDLDVLRSRWLELHPGDADKELPETVGKWFELYFDEHVEPLLVNPTFVTDYPTEISPLSRRNDERPEVVDRFELFIARQEVGNGFSELNDPIDQAGRFSQQAEAKSSGDDEAMYFDADYIRALSYGMPPTAGQGIGVDRLVMLLTGQTSIREVILFPALRRRAEDQVVSEAVGQEGGEGDAE
ncbi:MAG: lysine--tRNA ligase [Myxococcota bacterium]|nr:lysine--tRNA ligase [Myxococcota bacterium]